MLRQSLRVVALLLVLGAALLSAGAADAQTDSNDMIPQSVDLPPSAFQPAPSGDVAAAGAERIVESTTYGAPRVFTHLMIRWEMAEPQGSATRVEYRTSNDDRTWSDWASVEADDSEDTDHGTREYTGGVLYTGEARLYQFRATLSPGADGTYPDLRNLEASTVDTRISAPPGPLTQPEGDVSAAAVPMPAYKSRTAWGNPQGESAPGVTGAFATPRTATHLIIHHTAGNYHTLNPSTTNWDEHVRAIWSFHTHKQGWGDIGYNWLIAPNGVIYAGRAGSTYSDAVGFHDTANFGSMGVSILGDYSNIAPSTAAQESLVRILAWKASQRGIDPFGSGFYWGCTNWSKTLCARANPGGVVANIEGHRKITPSGYTTCPGNAFYALLPTIKSRVSQLINGGGSTPPGFVSDEQTTTFWKSAANWPTRGCGYGGQTLYTYATNNPAESTNHGVWRPNLPRNGYYRVYAHIPQGCGIASGAYATTNARYQIAFDGGQTERQIDHNAGSGSGQHWVELGTFRFKAGTDGSVQLTDLTSEAYSLRKVVFFDAVRWEHIGAELISAQPVATVVPTGGLLQVQFTVKNVGDVPLDTQTAYGASIAGVPDGYVYSETQCFTSSAETAKQANNGSGRLRVTLGPSDRNICNNTDGGYPWRWGLRTPLKPGEQRTITGYVKFDTRGTYTFRANLVNEWVDYYGTDGLGAPITVGPITVKDFPYRMYMPQGSR
jgi:hypothetical protein